MEYVVEILAFIAGFVVGGALVFLLVTPYLLDGMLDIPDIFECGCCGHKEEV